MKRSLKAAFLLSATLCSIVSCKKDKTEPAVITPTMYIPTSDAPIAASLMAVNEPTTDLGMPVPNVWGVFLSSALECRMNDTSDNLDYHLDYWQEAFFSGPDATGYAFPNAVSINNIAINRWNNIYYSEGVWRNDQLNHWEVTPNSDVPEVSANIQGNYPFYNGTIPGQVSLSQGLNFTFDRSKVVDADSGYVLIHNQGRVARSNTVNLRNSISATATIKPAQLSGMQNEYFSFNNKTFYGAVIEVVVVKDTIETFSDKQFVFAAQFEFARKITFK